MSTVTVLAETQLVSPSGELATFDSFLDKVTSGVNAYTVKKTRYIEDTYLTDFNSIMDTDTGEVVLLRFTDGIIITCQLGTQLLKEDGSWIQADQLTSGDTLRSVIYNPAHKHPELSFRQLAEVKKDSTPLIFATAFSIQGNDNILVGVESDNKFILLPLKPVTL